MFAIDRILTTHHPLFRQHRIQHALVSWGGCVFEELIKGERFAFIKGVPKLMGTPHKFTKCGQSGNEISDVMPQLQTVADDLCIIKSMNTDQFNHAPAQIFMNTGSVQFKVDGANSGSPVALSGGAAATSGGYGCRFDAAGLFTHILDPRTGGRRSDLRRLHIRTLARTD